MAFTQHTDEEYIQAIRASRGNLSQVARTLGINRQAVQQRLNSNLALKNALNDERDSFIDLAEDRLFNCVDKNSLPAIMFTLKTIGRTRGWGENQEIILTKNQDDQEYDLSDLTEEERGQLERLTAKIYKPRLIAEETSGS